MIGHIQKLVPYKKPALMTTLLLALWAFGPPTALPVADSIIVQNVAEGIFVFSASSTRSSTAEWVDGNVTAIVTEGGVVVVDAPSVRLARMHLAALRKITDQPVRYLVNTHWHYDHVFGNQVYKEAFPDVQIIAQARGKLMSDRRNPRIVERFGGDWGENYLKDLERAVETRQNDDGGAMTEDEYRRTIEAAGSVRRNLPSFKETRYTPPTLTFERSLDLILGGREIRILHFQGHSRGDAVVHLPRENILITGDLVIHPVPYGIRSFFEPWVDTLEELMQMNATAIIPGHGDVLHSNTYLALLRDLFASMLRQTYEAVEKGLTLEETREHIDIEAFLEKMVGGDPDRAATFRESFMAPAVGRMYQAARGEL